MRYNFRAILHLLGILLIINGVFMFLCVPFSFFYGEDWLDVLLAGFITSGVGGLTWIVTAFKQEPDLRRRDGYLIVTLGWLTLSLFGTLPYLISNAIPDFTNAFFETMSGYTTTGASILEDIESLPKGILLWRSLTQWIGGMGIIVLTVAILPILGIGGMQLFVAEAPGISPDKLQPRIQETAKRLWMIYVGLTFTEFILLRLGGMTYFDAINHSLTTMATGGFSTKQDSIAHFANPFIHYVIIVFMFFAGTNFTLIYFGLKGKFRNIWKSEEYRFYSILILSFSILVAISVYFVSDNNLENSFRLAAFQVVSVISTTGYVTGDYTAWSPFLTILFLVFMFIGASAGSTAGGVKVVRHLILLKNSILELKRQLHPSAVIPVRLNGKAIPPDINFNILAFIMLYITVFAAGSIIVASMGIDFRTSIGAVATSLGNIGPGIGNVGPVHNFSFLPEAVKWFLAFLMLLGRLELFTVLMLLSPYFWRTG